MSESLIYHGSGSAKQPWPTPAAAPSLDEKAKVSAADTTTSYLNTKIVAGTGIGKAILTPGGNETLEIRNTAPDTNLVIVDPSDPIPGNLFDKIEAGFSMQKALAWNIGIGYVDLRTRSRWWSDFSVTEPLLDNSACVKTGHWAFGAGSYDVTTAAGIADAFRHGVNGEFDYCLRVKSIAGAGYVGLQFTNRGSLNPFYIRVYNTGTIGAWSIPGATEISTVTGMPVASLEIRASYRDGGFYGYYRAIGGTWLLLNGSTPGFFGTQSSVFGVAQLCASVNAKIDRLYFADNANGAEDNPYHSQIVYMADGATITPANYQGNTFEVTLGGNRTLANPADNIPGQTIILRVRQDGTGGRTLTYGTKYRFRFNNVPLLSTIPSAVDILRFTYDPVSDKWDYDQIVPASQIVALTDAATITVDALKGSLQWVTLGGNRTLGNPSNPTAGQKIMFRIKQDGTGSRTLAYDTKYRFSTDLPSPTLTTTAAKTDYLGFIYHEVDDKWDFVGKVFGF